MSVSDYSIEERLVTPDEHRALMAAVGWQDHLPDEVLDRSLAASLHGVVAARGGRAVGMARLVGDGVHYFYVQDLVVHPDHQDEGLAPRMLRALLDRIDGSGVPSPFVGLFSSPEAEQLYRDAGFVTTNMTGMHRS